MRRIVVLFLLLSLTACGRPIPEGVVVLRYATPYSPSHPFSRADQRWMAFVENESNGRIQIRANWSGALLSSDYSMIELRHGVADVGLITPIYAKGGAHLIRVQSGFYSGVETVEQQVALYYCLAPNHRQFTRELAGLKILAVQGGSRPGIITRDRPVRSLDDLKGLRLRAPTELIEVLRHLGSDPVNMPMADVYSALAKGIIDGVIAPPDTFKALHFAEVADHYTTLSVPRGAYPARAMDEERWQSLPPHVRRILERSISVWEEALASAIRAAQKTGIRAARESGVQFHSVSPEDQARFDRLYLRDAKRNAASLARYGINGLSVFETARASITTDGNIACKGSE